LDWTRKFHLMWSTFDCFPRVGFDFIITNLNWKKINETSWWESDYLFHTQFLSIYGFFETHVVNFYCNFKVGFQFFKFKKSFFLSFRKRNRIFLFCFQVKINLLIALSFSSWRAVYWTLNQWMKKIILIKKCGEFFLGAF
jgi:hypothetical protein